MDKGLIIKLLIGVVVLAILGTTGFILHKKFKKNKGEEIVIKETPNVVAEIKKISQLATACFYEELPIKEVRKGRFSDDELVFVARGTVRAGFDLAKLDSTGVEVKGDTLWVDLPHAEIFDVRVNPSDISVYYEEGDWDHPSVTELESKARKQIKQDAIKDGIVGKATQSGVKKLYEIFKLFGFSEVTITIEGQEYKIKDK